MHLTIATIDASLASTGICIAELNFDETLMQSLTRLMLGEISVETQQAFSDSFKAVDYYQNPELKHQKKDLAKLRKKVRDEDPCMKTNADVEVLHHERLLHQSKHVRSMLESIKNPPDFIITEDYSYHSQGSLTMLAELKGLMRDEILDFQSELSKISVYLNAPIPSIRKIVARHGNANKELICEELIKFGFGFDVKKQNDTADAVAISIATFYALYNRLFGLSFPDGKNAKEKKKYVGWQESVDKFSDRIGSKDDIECLISQGQ